MIEHLYYGVRLFSFNAKFNLSWLIIIYGDPGTTSYPPNFCMLNKAPRGSIRSKIFMSPSVVDTGAHLGVGNMSVRMDV